MVIRTSYTPDELTTIFKSKPTAGSNYTLALKAFFKAGSTYVSPNRGSIIKVAAMTELVESNYIKPKIRIIYYVDNDLNKELRDIDGITYLCIPNDNMIMYKTVDFEDFNKNMYISKEVKEG